MKNLLISFFTLTLAVMLGGCEHKELCYHHPHTSKLRLDFDWMDAPDADPDGMCVYFYPVIESDNDQRTPQRFDFHGTTGGEIELTDGRYRVIAYNNDTETHSFLGTDDYFSHRISTRTAGLFESIGGNGMSAPPRAEGSEEERVVLCPEQMWGCTAEVDITPEGVTYISVPQSARGPEAEMPREAVDRVVMLYPHDLMCHYSFEIRNVENLDRVTQMSASLSGMAPMLIMHEEELGAEPVTLPLEAAAADERTITGQFLTWGHHPDNEQPHRMVLYVWMDNGAKYCFGLTEDRFDVTEQVHSAPDRRRVHIIIDGLGLPVPMEGDTGMDPSVDDWIEINQDINI